MGRASHHRGVTIVELLIVVTVIAALLGLLLPAIQMVRNATRKSATVAMVQQLQSALRLYSLEDNRHRLPPMEADRSLRTSAGTGGAARTLDLLRNVGLEWRVEQLSDGALLDGWQRPYRYVVDDNRDGVADRPAPQSDWNAKGEDPYAYVWSIGKPTTAGDADDGAPASAERWLYTRTSP